MEIGKKSLLPGLRMKIGALKMLSKNIPVKGRRILTNGMIVGKLLYLIPVWGGTHESNLKKTQHVLNSAARVVLGADKKTRVRTLMEDCGWLYVREMVKYQSLVVLWKMIRMGRPTGMSRKLEVIEEDKIRTQNSRLQIVSSNFKERTTLNWNDLPRGMRSEKLLPRFKKCLKSWIIASRDLQ